MVKSQNEHKTTLNKIAKYHKIGIKDQTKQGCKISHKIGIKDQIKHS